MPPHDFGEKHPANPHDYVPKRSKNDFFWGELSNSGAPGGPRYDPLQSAEERRHASNGIWLCSAHAKQIADDYAHFTVDKLKTWKKQAEERSALAILTL